MHLGDLRINDLRSIEESSISLVRGWNVFVGPNGAGKTSVLESVFLLSHGRSFRRSSRDSLSRLGSSGFSVFGVLEAGQERSHRLGLARRGGRLEVRVDGEVTGIAGLVQKCAVVCFEPGSHELISGVSEERRRFLDWGVFHVEPDFLLLWRRYQRALRQRNSALRDGAEDAFLEPWEVEMTMTGVRIAMFRESYLERLRPLLQDILDQLLPELGFASVSLDQGWKSDQDLAVALLEGRGRDRDRGYTGRGPHRADWGITFERAPKREHLSRGQEKLCALALILAQARLYAATSGEWPILCLDDLASELDRHHLEQIVAQLRMSPAQILLSGTELPQVLDPSMSGLRVFHVEQGRIDA
jgi:DNA replication and repair protein RecF